MEHSIGVRVLRRCCLILRIVHCSAMIANRKPVVSADSYIVAAGLPCFWKGWTRSLAYLQHSSRLHRTSGGRYWLWLGTSWLPDARLPMLMCGWNIMTHPPIKYSAVSVSANCWSRFPRMCGKPSLSSGAGR